MLYNTIQYYAILYNTILCYTICNMQVQVQVQVQVRGRGRERGSVGFGIWNLESWGEGGGGVRVTN